MTCRTIEYLVHCLALIHRDAASVARSRQLATWVAASGVHIGPTPIHRPRLDGGDERDGFHRAQRTSVMVGADQQAALLTSGCNQDPAQSLLWVQAVRKRLSKTGVRASTQNLKMVGWFVESDFT